MNLQDTRPAEIDGNGNVSGDSDRWAAFRIGNAAERLRLLRQLRDGQTPVTLNGPDGCALQTTLWSIDSAQQRISFSTDGGAQPQAQLVQADEAIAVAYLESVKLQFELHGFVVVHGIAGNALQCALPQHIYRLQRRGAYRVRPPDRAVPTARLRHPSIPDMVLTLRLADISIGGCALWLPNDVPPLQAGTQLADVQIALDGETRFVGGLRLQHVSAMGHDEPGLRMGCEWLALPGSAERQLQRWIDRTQQRRRLLSLG